MRENATDRTRTEAAGDPPADARPPFRPPPSERGRDGRSIEARSADARTGGANSRRDAAGRAGGGVPSRGRPASDGRPAEDGRSAEDDRAESGSEARASAEGTVFLVGSGPGSPELLTRRAWNLLTEADAVLYDSLTGDDIIADLPASVDTVDVGKRPPARTPQNEIHRLMRDRARRGERVVRLKGGDPTVFGRGGEEAEFLADAGVPFEIVPGVSSVLAAPGANGIPLTHRERASSVTVVTGHETPDKDDSALDWGALADTVTAGGTLVILMGVRRLPDNVAALREHGVPAETPAAMVEKATWADERVVEGTLGDIAARSRDAGVEPPAVTVVGDVVSVRDEVAAELLR